MCILGIFTLRPSCKEKECCNINDRSDNPSSETAKKEILPSDILLCQVCNKSFTLKFALEQHQKKHLVDNKTDPEVRRNHETQDRANASGKHQTDVSSHIHPPVGNVSGESARCKETTESRRSTHAKAVEEAAPEKSQKDCFTARCQC